MDIKNIMLLGVVGYLATTLKSIPSSLCDYVVLRYSRSLTVYSTVSLKYELFEKTIIGFGLKTILNHSAVENILDRDTWVWTPTKIISLGDYLCYVGNFTWVTVKKRKMSEQTLDLSTTFSVFGFDKDKYIDLLNKSVNVESQCDKIKVFPFSRESDFIYQPKRDFSTIFNPEKERIVTHIDKWLSRRAFLNSNGMLNKTGILLYGKHGTGKSSVARAIATKLEYSLHVISLRAYKDQDALISRISSIKPKSVILFEEIDTVVKNREDTNNSSNNENELLGVLLNILDGSLSPDGVIFVATTNYLDKLDSALTRTGRFDLSIELKDLSYNDAKIMVDYYGCSNFIDLKTDELYNPSDLQCEIFKYI